MGGDQLSQPFSVYNDRTSSPEHRKYFEYYLNIWNSRRTVQALPALQLVYLALEDFSWLRLGKDWLGVPWWVECKMFDCLNTGFIDQNIEQMVKETASICKYLGNLAVVTKMYVIRRSNECEKGTCLRRNLRRLI